MLQRLAWKTLCQDLRKHYTSLHFTSLMSVRTDTTPNTQITWMERLNTTNTAKHWTSNNFQAKPTAGLSKANSSKSGFWKPHSNKSTDVPRKGLICKTNNIQHIFKTLPDSSMKQIHTVSSNIDRMCIHVWEVGSFDSESLAGRKGYLTQEVWWVVRFTSDTSSDFV